MSFPAPLSCSLKDSTEPVFSKFFTIRPYECILLRLVCVLVSRLHNHSTGLLSPQDELLFLAVAGDMDLARSTEY